MVSIISLDSTFGHDPWPPIEVGISFTRDETTITYALTIKNIANYDLSGLTLRGQIPPSTTLRNSWVEKEGKEPGQYGGGEISWYDLGLKAGEKKGPFFYRLGFDGSRNITARAWVGRGGPAIAFSKSITWHPRIVMSAGHSHLGHRFPAKIAKHKGWFKEEGLLDYEIKFSGDDAHTIAGMEKGEIDIGLDPKPDKIIPAFVQGIKLYIIGAMRNTNPYFFIGAKGVKSIQELRGKAIGVREPDGVGTLQIKKLLKQAGVDPEREVTWIRTGPSTPRIQKPYFERGEIQASVVRNYDALPFLEEGYPVLANFREIYPDGYQSRVIAATERMVNRYPETLKSFLKGIIKAYRFMTQAKNHHELIQVIDEAEARREDPDGFIPDLPPGYYAEIWRSTHPQDGTPNLRGLQLVIDNEKRLGRLDESFTIDEVIRLQFVEEAAKELGLR